MHRLLHTKSSFRLFIVTKLKSVSQYLTPNNNECLVAMSFLDAIKPLIKLCHILGLAPYSRIANTTTWAKNRVNELVTIAFFIINVGIFSIYLISNGAIIDYDDPSLIIAICIYSFVIVCVQTFIVLCEVYYKRNQHIKLLNIFEKLESIFNQNHRIQLDNSRLKRILRRAISFWVLETFGLLALNIVIWLKTNASDEFFFFLMYTVPQLISKLSFIFWTILVVNLQEHVKVLVNYVSLFTQIKADSIKHEAIKFKFLHGKYRTSIVPRDYRNLIEYLKKCYVLVWEASILINDIVFWSFPVGFLNELSVLVFNCFFTIQILQLPEILFMHLLHISSWGAMNMINVIFVATMCGKSVETVIYI